MIRTTSVAAGILILLCIMCIVPVLAAGSSGYWNPWVTKTNTTSATINWWQESAGKDWTVKYANGSYYDNHGVFDHTMPDPDPDLVNFHHVLITGLAPNTTYKYLVEPSDNSNIFAVRKFQTFPVSGPFTFIVISDSHASEKRFKYVGDALNNEQGVLFVLHGGDYANNDNATEWTDFFNYGDGMLANYSIFTNIGNHEYHNITHDHSSTDAYEYRYAFDNPLNYSFDCAGIRFVVLDSPDPDSTDDQNPTLAHTESQESWLKEQLDNKMSGTFVIDHHPIWTYGRASPESALLPWETLFHTYPISADFSGHIHTYQRFSVNGIPYFIVANGGGKFVSINDGKPYPSSYVYGATKNLGYLRVMVDPSNNSATANEYFVAWVEDYNTTTATVISPPLLADNITFPLRAIRLTPTPLGNSGGESDTVESGRGSSYGITSPGGPAGSTVTVALNQAVTANAPGADPSGTPPIPVYMLVAGAAGTAVVVCGGFFVRRWWIRRKDPTRFKKYD
ncbi:MAG: metallophosphoesterase family protein [Methanoregula sp.]|jgi:predicted phosphodiesterase